MCVLNIIEGLIKTGVLIFGACVAWSGLTTWKKQLKGSHEYALAKNILLQSYKYQEAMAQLRHPAVFTYEYPKFSNDQINDMRQNEKRYQEMHYVYQKRWDNVIAIKPMLREAILESQVIWGEDLRKIYEKIFTLEFNIHNGMAGYLEAIKNDDDTKKIRYQASVFDSQAN